MTNIDEYKEDIMKKETKLIDLPVCSIRKGRIFDGKAVITCGYGFIDIDAEECIKCGGDDMMLNRQKK
jgi:hypothetical protein